MKLAVDLTVYKIARKLNIEKISIKLGSNSDKRLVCFPNPAPNYSKFKREPRRILKELNRGTLTIESGFDIWSTWPAYLYDEKSSYVVFIESADLLSKVYLSLDIRNTVRAELSKRIMKERTYNPSKEKSEMEYRKRAYYGKCKR